MRLLALRFDARTLFLDALFLHDLGGNDHDSKRRNRSEETRVYQA